MPPNTSITTILTPNSLLLVSCFPFCVYPTYLQTHLHSWLTLLTAQIVPWHALVRHGDWNLIVDILPMTFYACN